ncbi:MAG: PDZ domain-containing protein [Nitrospirota bacterium]
MGPMRIRMDSAMMNRAALGLRLTPTGSARDTLGVFVAAVTPKGPAENAGVVEGDRIVSINGVDLRVASGDVEDGYASGLPSHRLSREVEKLTPGSRVNLRVYSGGRVRDVQVTAGRASDLMKMRFGNMGLMGGEGPGNMMIFRGGMPEGPMPPMAGMQGMERMHMMMPGMEPGMRAMEMIPRMRMMEGEMGRLRSRSMEHGGTYRLRSPARVRVYSPSRLKEEKIEKARADSAKAKAKR